MEIFGILDPDPDPHKNLCGSETLGKTRDRFLLSLFCSRSVVFVPGNTVHSALSTPLSEPLMVGTSYEQVLKHVVKHILAFSLSFMMSSLYLAMHSALSTPLSDPLMSGQAW